MSTEQVLAERQKTHGSFEEHAALTQALKDTVRDSPGWNNLSWQHSEALEMILHKIGRIMAGNPNYTDHWVDIAGYATLGERACTKSTS